MLSEAQLVAADRARLAVQIERHLADAAWVRELVEAQICGASLPACTPWLMLGRCNCGARLS